MDCTNNTRKGRTPWNKGKLVGQKPPLKLHEIWSIRVRLQLSNRIRDLALFNLAIDSKLRSCDLVKIRVRDISHGTRIEKRATVMQQKTQKPVRFEITKQTRESIAEWMKHAGLSFDDYLFKGRKKIQIILRPGTMAGLLSRGFLRLGLIPLLMERTHFVGRKRH